MDDSGGAAAERAVRSGSVSATLEPKRLDSAEDTDDVDLGSGRGSAGDSRRRAARSGGDALVAQIGLYFLALGPFVGLLVLFITMSVLSPVFLTERNMTNLSVQAAPIAILAVGQFLVVLIRGVDLSVGSTIALSTVLGAEAFDRGASPALVVAAILGTGGAIGLVNAVLIVKLRIANPIIVTLGMLFVVSGLALLVADNAPNPGMPRVVIDAGSSYAGRIPVPAMIACAVGFLGWVFVTRMKCGRWFVAVGGNPEAARRVGLPVDAVTMAAYVLSGLAAGLTALLIAGSTNSGYPTAGQRYEMIAVSAVIVGGASFFGGRGDVPSVIVGALILAAIRNGLNLLGVNVNWQVVVTGAVLIAAVGVDTLRIRLETALRSQAARGAAP